jgi:hypothetical protein
VRPFGFGDMTFDSYMIVLSNVLSLLPFVVKISVGTSGDGENCTVSGKVVDLLQRVTDL